MGFPDGRLDAVRLVGLRGDDWKFSSYGFPV
jgi:hypothetical protein